MEIHFSGKYKSIISIDWIEIPSLAIITGPNGTGKSQLLDLIYNSILEESDVVSFKTPISKSEVTFLKGEWYLANTSSVDLSTIKENLKNLFNKFKEGIRYGGRPDSRLVYEIMKLKGVTTTQSLQSIDIKEFESILPDSFAERDDQIGQKIGEVFYHYRLSEIELQAKGFTDKDIIQEIGEKPWVVLREIIKESKLPFEINDASNLGFRDSFQLQLKHQISNEYINFSDLSSGEKVLLSLVFYLYNSQEKKVFPKLLLLDEPDAHLHPSMSQQFLNVIKNVLVDKFGVKVIMTTHSPSTVMLAPSESIYEMSIVEPRIKKAQSKNQAVSLLTSGLVYVGEGTRYILVEDKDDVDFYSYIYDKLISEKRIANDIPLVFIPASTKDRSGGCSVIQSWVEKLQASGLVGVIYGLIDADYGNEIFDGVFKINRYSIENYLIDPLIIYAALIDKGTAPKIEGVNLTLGEEYKLKIMPEEKLQLIIDHILDLISQEISQDFDTFDSEKVEVEFQDGQKLLYPRWLLELRGKTLLNQTCNRAFTSKVVNFSTLFKAMKKMNLFPKEIVLKFEEIQKFNI